MKMTSSATLVAWSPMRSRWRDTRIRSSDGSTVREFTADVVGPSGLVQDGETMWITSTHNSIILHCDLNGKTIKAGDKLAMWYISGNRDEEAIENPNVFQIDRARPRQHHMMIKQSTNS